MKIGYRTIELIRNLEAKAATVGFKIGPPKHRTSYSSDDYMGLYPSDQEGLPIYARDSELFVGTLEEVCYFIRGIEWAREYDRMLKLSDKEKRERKEQDWRNQNIANILRGEKVHTVDIINRMHTVDK